LVEKDSLAQRTEDVWRFYYLRRISLDRDKSLRGDGSQIPKSPWLSVDSSFDL
jgi:hypothetical protein